MKIKRYLCSLLVISMMLSGMVFSVSADFFDKLSVQNFDNAEDAQFSELSLIEGHNWTGTKTNNTLISGMYGRGQTDKSLEFTASGYEVSSSSAGILVTTPSGVRYATDNSYLLQASVYVPLMENEVLSVTAGVTYTRNGSEANLVREQFLHTNGQIRKSKDTATGNTYLQNGWNLISVHFNRQGTDNFRYRLYVNGSCHCHNETFYIDEGTSLEDIFLRFCFVDKDDNAEREIEGKILIDDIILVKGISAGDIWPLYIADITSEEYKITETAVTHIPDNVTVGEVTSNITGGCVYAVDMEADGSTRRIGNSEPIKEATNLVSINELGVIKIRDIGLAKTINGIVIPTEDFTEEIYDTLAWQIDGEIENAAESSILFEAVNGEVTSGDNSSPYTVGGFWHVGFDAKENLTITKNTVDSIPFYHFKSETQGNYMTVRGQGANLDEAKMTRSKYSIVEFIYRAEELSHFNVSFRYKVNGEVKTSDALLGQYETENITFSPNGKIYLGGCREKIDPNAAVYLGEYETGVTYNVALVLEFPHDDTIRVDKVIINGKTVAQNIDFEAYMSGITQLCEIDLYMGAASADTAYNLMVSGAKCYTADGYVNVHDTVQRASMINFGGNSYALLDGESASDGSEFYLLSNQFFSQEKFDSFTDRNHELLAKAEFDLSDEYNLSYKLNDETDSESVVSKLQSLFGGTIIEHDWLCESYRQPDGINVTTKIGLLSEAEMNKYSELIGTADANDGFWWLRNGSKETEHDIMCVSNSNPRMIVNRKAHGTMYVRPSFYVDDSFFKTQKLEYIGSEAARILEQFYTRADLDVLYTENEINKFFERPTVTITAIEGKTVVGQQLTIKYDWLSNYDETESEYRWYSADASNGEYSLIDGEASNVLTLTEGMAGKYIKAAVIPKSSSRINPVGAEVITEFSTNIVYNSNMISTMIEDINDEDASTLYSKLGEYNNFNNLNLNLKDEDISQTMTILSKMDLNYDNIEDMYNAAVALTRLNKAELSDIEEILRSDELRLDITYYNRLDAKEQESVQQSMHNKCFDDYAEFAEKFKTTVAVLEFDGANREELYMLLNDYRSSFTTDLSNFSEYQLRQIAARLENTYLSFDMVDSSVTAAANQVLSTVEDNSNIIPNRGGGGGSGGGSNTYAAILSTPAEIPEIADRYNDLHTVPWAAPIIEELSDMGILSGTGDGKFSPDRNLKREEFASMLVRAFGLEGESSIEYDDVDKNSWYAGYVEKATAAGVISGYGDGRFGIGDEITREDMVVMIYRIIKDKLPEIGSWLTVNDIYDAYDYAKEPLIIMMKAGIISGTGDSNVNPKGKATRAMAARVLYLAMQKNGNI